MNEIEETILQRADAKAGQRQAVRMLGIQSIKEGMEFEARAIEQEAKDVRDAVYGCECAEMKGETDSEGTGETDPMRDILATGPVYINSPQTESSEKENKPVSPSQSQLVAKPPMSKPLAWGLGAAALLTALTLPILAYNMTRADPPAETPAVNIGARFVPVPDDFTN